MTIRLRTAFIIAFAFIVVLFLYLERAILVPFLLAAIFAYIINPVVNFFTDRLRLPRLVSVFLIYIAIMAVLVFLSITITSRVLDESSELRVSINNITKIFTDEAATLPSWIRPSVDTSITSLRHSKLFAPESIFTFFPEAISRIVSFLIFAFCGFYFLKEGRDMIDRILRFVPRDFQYDADMLLNKINIIFKNYLRGQIILVIVISLILYIALTILGVRFALILAIFSGFAEIIPIIGPITAGAVAALVVLIGGVGNFSLPPIQAAGIVIIIYFIVRQFQDYFLTPHVMGKITDLHPLIILFAVLSGGHFAGPLGLILAVPVAATIKVFLDYLLDKINERGYIQEKKEQSAKQPLLAE